MRNFLVTGVFASLLFAAPSFAAATPPTPPPTDVASVFQSYVELGTFPIKVPTVVEVPLTGIELNRTDVALIDVATGGFEPTLFISERIKNEIALSAQTVSQVGSAASSLSALLDNNVLTFREFSLPETGQGKVEIVLTGVSPVTSSSLTLLLDANVALPTSVTIRKDGGVIVLAATRPTSADILFPKTTSKTWTFSLTYGQPLRITEIKLRQENATVASASAVRFLAKPEESYRLYLDPDRYVRPPVGESGNLAGTVDILRLESARLVENPAFKPADTDTDSIPDTLDNCVSVPNDDQRDVDTNGRGDACDDFDRDGLINDRDNCPEDPNRNQTDTDGDGIGDVCDPGESRLTEMYPWLPWAGMGFAALVLITLFGLMLKPKIPKMTFAPSQPTPPAPPQPPSNPPQSTDQF